MTVGWLAPSRLRVEASPAFALAGGSTRYGSPMNPIVSVVGDNPRMAGIGDLGCSGNRECAPCAAKRAGTTLQGLGYVGLGAQPAPENRSYARTLLSEYAAALSSGSDAVASGDLDAAGVSLAALRNLTDARDLVQNDSGMSEVAASYEEALGAMTAAFNALAALKYPQGGQGRSTPADVQVAWTQAKNVAIRMAARAASSDFDAPAALNADDQNRVAALERLMAAGISQQEANAMLARCNPASMFVDGLTAEQWAASCKQVVAPGLDFGKIVLLGLGVLALTFVAGRVS